MVRTASKIVIAIALVSIWAVGAPTAAEAQNRGIMQVSARVVDTRPAFQALESARAATAAWAASRPTDRNDAATVAQVTVAPRREVSGDGRLRVTGLVVSIEYVKS